MTKGAYKMKMSKTFYGGAVIDSKDSREFDLGYRIILQYYKTCNSLMVKEENTYGVEIVKTEQKGEEVKTEIKDINNITTSEEVADEILEMLTNYKVTPITATEIIEDFIK